MFSFFAGFLLWQEDDDNSLALLMEEINGKIAAKENLIGALVGASSSVELEVRTWT